MNTGVMSLPLFPARRRGRLPYGNNWVEFNGPDITAITTSGGTNTITYDETHYREGNPDAILRMAGGAIQVMHEGVYHYRAQFYVTDHAQLRNVDAWILPSNLHAGFDNPHVQTFNGNGWLQDGGITLEGEIRLWAQDSFQPRVILRAAAAFSCDIYGSWMVVRGPLMQSVHYVYG